MKYILLVALLLACHAVADNNSKDQYTEGKQVSTNKDGQKNRINKVKQYLESRNLGNLVIDIQPYKTVDNQYLIITWNKNTKLTSEQKKELIRLHHATYSRKAEYSLLNEMYYEIAKYLVYYAIDNKDEQLMRSILFDNVLKGDGSEASYSETYDETCKLPFYMYYPNIDRYLNQKEVERAADIISEVIDRYNQVTGNDKGIWEKYNSTFIFPDKYTEKKYKYVDFIKILHKQSPRLAREVDYWHMRTVLGVNGLMGTEDENDFWR